MSFDFDATPDRRGSGSNKWSRYAADVLPMWVADMDFAVAPAITAALAQRLSHPVFGYAAASDGLRAAIVAHCKARYGWQIAAQDIVFLPGVEPGFNMALKAFAQPGEGVVVNTPVYRPILNAPAHWGLHRQDVPLSLPSSLAQQATAADDPVLTSNDLDAALQRSSVYLLCNPHNPIGKAFSRNELQSIVDACAKRNVCIVSDEIHCDLLFDGRRHVPIASLSSEAAQRSVTLMAASKAFNIAGLKTAFAIIQNPVMRQRFEATRLGMVDSVNLFGLVATQAALEDADPWRQALIAYLQANRDHLQAAVRDRLPGVRMVSPQATFLAWLDCSSLGLKSNPQQFFLKHGKVAFSAGSEFGATNEGWLRLNFGCSRALLDEAIDRMAAALKQR